MINTARIMDLEAKMMDLSITNFFHWGVLCNNRSALARAQYAMIFQCVVLDYDNAERLYRQVRCCLTPWTIDLAGVLTGLRLSGILRRVRERQKKDRKRGSV